MLSRNQLKVGRVVFRDNDQGEIGGRCRCSSAREKRVFLGEHRSDQQKTYGNETGEHTSGQGPIFIQDWQAHLGNKE